MKTVIVTIAQAFLFSLVVLVASPFTASAEKTDPDKKNEIKQPKSFAVGMYLNPAKMKVYIAIDKLERQPIKIVLRDSAGKVYYEEFISGKMQNYRSKFDMAELAEGTYTFDLIGREETLSRSVEISQFTDKIIAMQ